MVEIDWDEVVVILDDLIEHIDETSTELCTKKFLRGCSVIQGQVLPPLKALLKDVKRPGNASKGLWGGLIEEEEEEEEAPETPRTEEEREARHRELFEEELRNGT